MDKNHLKPAVRLLTKRKGYFLLNIAGLIAGITCSLFIFHYVSYEKSYDNFQPLSAQIARLRLDVFQNGRKELQSAAVYPAIAPALKKDFPEVEDFCRLHNASLTLSNTADGTKYNETKGFYADPSFLEMFAVTISKWNGQGLLSEPYQILLSETMAKKYFGSSDAVGKKIISESPSFLQTYLVVGVYKDYPANTHLSFDYLISYSTYDRYLQHYGYPARFSENSWEFRDFYAYIQVRKGIPFEKIQSRLPAFCEHYINNRDEKRNNNNHDELYLTPVRDIHLYSDSFYEAGSNGNGQAVTFLFIIALFIVCIAWINYINLATARAAERAREVGVRKLLGAARADLIRQFFAEGFLLNTVALLISVVLFLVFVDFFDSFTGKSMTVRPLLSAKYVQLSVTLFLSGSFLSCIYPSFVLSAFKPVTVLKGLFKNSSQGILLRKGLIVFQFVISIVLITATIIVYQQLNYMRNQPTGADIRQTLILKGSASLPDSVYHDRYQSFKLELLQTAGVKGVTASTSVMGNEIAWTRNAKRIDTPGASAVPLHHIGIDYDFIPQYSIKIIGGRNFSRQFSTDNKAVLLNEKSLQLLGFQYAEQAINRKIIRSADTVTIIGVVADFHQQGLQQQIKPMIFLLQPDCRNYYSVKIQAHTINKTMSSLEKSWKEYFPGEPFTYLFLDTAFNQQYKSEILFGKVFGLFALLSISISCFGLLGLSAYTVLQRAKEISIRKLLGAGVWNIISLLITEFTRLIAVSFIISVPAAWLIMNRWLQDFAYRITIHWWVFILGGFIALLIAASTILFHTIEAAIANPVRSLRTE